MRQIFKMFAENRGKLRGEGGACLDRPSMAPKSRLLGGEGHMVKGRGGLTSRVDQPVSHTPRHHNDTRFPRLRFGSQPPPARAKPGLGSLIVRPT